MASKVFTVTEINLYLKNIIQNDIILSHLYIKGEISNLKIHTSGHAYFTLKDRESLVKCVMFRSSLSRLAFVPENGMAVVIRGYFSVYERDGQYQLYAESMIPEGTGALYKAYEQLKGRLSEEGLFEPEFKKKIPFLPKTVGIITSPTGAAVRDIISIIKRRCPFVDILLYPVQVQGDVAAGEICEGIRYFNTYQNVDVIIAGRGGGAIEELWAFNEEIVARAIFESQIPIISAVGHETDFTIADFVSDLRAPTPSAAAELAVPDRYNLSSTVSQMRYRLSQAIHGYIERQKSHVEALSRDNSFRQIEIKILNLSQTLDMLDKELNVSMMQTLQGSKNRLLTNIEKLNLLNPASALLRGYTYVKDEASGNLLTSAKGVHVGDKIHVVLKDGTLRAEVQSIDYDGPKGLGHKE